jgi:C-terminal processing protease CtpA/Prc
MHRMIARVFGVALAVGALSASAQSGDPWDPKHDNDIAERFEWSTGPSRLGVMVMGMTRELRAYFHAPAEHGVIVAQVAPDSAAERAGIRVGDVLVAVAGHDVTTGADVIVALAARQGEQVKIGVIRQGRSVVVDAKIPQAEPEARLQTDAMEST